MRFATVIAVPTYGTVDIQWAQARARLAQPLGSVVGELYDATDRNIAEKRNDLVSRVLEMNADTIFFIGDDVIVPPFALLQMLHRIRAGYKVVTGIYWTRTSPPQPYIFQRYMEGPFYDWHVGEFFPIDLAGADCLMVDLSVFRTIPPPWFSLDYHYWPNSTPNEDPVGTCTEDFYFFSLLRKYGIQAWCDAGIQCGHIDRQTHLMYSLPQDWPQAHPGSEIPRRSKELIADIGCGYRMSPIHLEGDVVRFDLDGSCNPQVRCDVRRIPEPDEKYDRVYAAHVLEHLPANDAIPAIREWTRILKTGGKIEIMVPNLDAVVRQIKDGRIEPHLHQMIWGSQTHPRDYHFSGFTPPTLRNLIASAGNLDIEEIQVRPFPGPEQEIYIRAVKTSGTKPPVLGEIWDNAEVG